MFDGKAAFGFLLVDLIGSILGPLLLPALALYHFAVNVPPPASNISAYSNRSLTDLFECKFFL